MIAREAVAEGPLLSILGDLDFSNVTTLEHQLESLEAEPVVIVSLSEATFIDSSVLGALVRRHHKRVGALVVILPPRSALCRIFDITDLRSVLNIVPDLPRAREAVAAKRELGAAPPLENASPRR